MIMANHVKYEGPLNFFNGVIKILEADLNAQNWNGKKYFMEKLKNGIFLLFCAIFSLKMIFIIDRVLKNVSNFDMMVAPTMVTSVPNRVFEICSI